MFSYIDNNSVRSYIGQPDCEAGYNWILDLLRETTAAWLTSDSDFNPRIKGNIGEFLAFHLTREHNELGEGWYIFYSNADTPLARISGSGLDICFLYLGKDITGTSDMLVIQEAKTTGLLDLSYAQNLVNDHEKLKSADPSLNLQARVRALKARMRDIYKIKDKAILDRVQNLAHPDPAKCDKVKFLPTLVHDRNATTHQAELEDVRSKIAGQGWNISLIFPVSISLMDLDNGFKSLAQNRSFKP